MKGARAPEISGPLREGCIPTVFPSALAKDCASQQCSPTRFDYQDSPRLQPGAASSSQQRGKHRLVVARIHRPQIDQQPLILDARDHRR